MKHLIYIVIFLFSILNLNAQCNNAKISPIENPTKTKPTIYIANKITQIDREASEAFRRNCIRVNNDNRYPIIAVSEEFVAKQIVELKAQNRYGKQNFIVAKTLHEAYEIDAGLKEVILFEVKKD